MSQITKIILIYTLFLISQPGISDSGSNPGFRFIENKNQWDENVKYRADIPGGYLFLKTNSIHYAFYDARAVARRHIHETSTPASRTSVAPPTPPDDYIRAHGFEVKFLEANPRPEFITSGQNPVNFNYFLGKNPEKWASGAKAFNAVTYQELYPGINLKYYQNELDLKYEFIVEKGTNPKVIKMDYDGVIQVKLINDHLYIQTSVNTLIEQKPYSYQVIDGKKVEVPSRFKVKNNRVSFQFPKGYDKNYDLIIDPILVFSTFSGAFSDNWGNTATFDNDGNLYSGGTVFGPEFPVTVGAFQVNFNQATDIGILKYDSTGSNLIYATFLGGGFSETPHSLVVNNKEELVIFGSTSSPDFPFISTSYDTTFAGGDSVTNLISGVDYINGADIFISILDPTGSNLVGSTFFGGSDHDGINETEKTIFTRNYGDQFRGEVIVDELDNIYISSSTHSADFDITPNAFQKTLKGPLDGIIAKFNPDVSQLIWSTYLGGDNYDIGYSIKINSYNEIVVAGSTNSENFPTTSGVYLEDFQGGFSDGFISIISQGGDSLISSTYLGTDDYDQAFLMDLDPADNVTVFGQTSGDYPVSVNVYSNPGSGQFVHKLGASLKTSVFSTVVGSGSGSPDITPTAFMVNDCSNIYLAGWGGVLNSADPIYIRGGTQNLPITFDAFQTTTDDKDFYLMILSSNADELLYATFFGGPEGVGEHVDGGTSRFDRRGIIYHSVCSCNNQSGFPTTPNAYSTTNNSTNCNNAAFKFDLAILEASFDASAKQGCAPMEVVLTNTSKGGTRFEWKIDGVEISDSDTTINHIFNTPGSYPVSLQAFDLSTCAISDIIYDTIQVDPQNFSVGDSTFICEGDQVQLSAGGGVSYLWSPAEFIVDDPTLPNPIAMPNATTNFTVRITNEYNCVADSQQMVEVQPEVIADFEAIVMNGCDSVQEVQVINKSQNATLYAWFPGDDRLIEGENPGIIPFPKPGTYDIVLLAVSRGCSDSDTITVTVGESPAKEFYRNAKAGADQAICYGDQVEISASGGVNYQWSPTVGLNNPNIANPMANPIATTQYTVRIFSEDGCYVDDTVIVDVNPEIIADFEYKMTQECGNLPEVELINNSSGATTFIWEMGNNETLTDENPSMYVYPDTGSYVITLRAISGSCEVSTTQSIRIENVIPPNVITPNGDEKNENFVIESQLSGWKLQIFNRWGDKVFETDDYQNNWNGSDLPESTYNYFLVSPIGAECKGWITLMRGN
ncbi:gliding motility-associated C-terminal domain-containing protein [Flexithrix dorotheae]|uniref:DUF7948 domain-containing protein n=1 Tax=Flexithrix dorotheae TaxID=70993 RepID=UPI0003801276|nr:gliding motility-associated C-terminal domain-containing protein [Flexithrix dorotheae]